MTRLTGALGLDVPLLQAGMGGVAGPELCAAVSAAGAGGTLGLYRSSPAAVARLVAAVAARTSRPFGVNVIPEVAGTSTARAQVAAALGGLPASGFVTFFGLPDRAVAADVLAAGRPVVVEVGTVGEADAAVDLGADVVVLQGVEAGGHHLGTGPALRLLDAVRARHAGAVLAVAGGIATGADLAGALARGADGGMAGTLFVPTVESRAHPVFKARVAVATARDTVVTRAFDIGWPGRAHRVLRNALTESAERRPEAFIATTTVDGRPVPVARYSAAAPSVEVEGAVEEMAMYCGCSCERVGGGEPVAAVVARFRAELHAALAGEPVA